MPFKRKVVGAAEASEILGVELQRISRWRKIGKLPFPYANLRLSPVWMRSDIERVRDSGEVNGATEPPSVLCDAQEAEGVLSMLTDEFEREPPLSEVRRTALAKGYLLVNARFEEGDEPRHVAADEVRRLEPPLLGTAEVAVLLDQDKSQISRWRSRPNRSGPKFPEPAALIKAGPLWEREDIELFAVERAAWLDQKANSPTSG